MVFRFALRPSRSEIVDPLDLEEAKKSIYCLRQPAFKHVSAFLGRLIKSPVLFFLALNLSVKMGLRSERGLLKHLIYFIEACTFYTLLKKEQIQHVHVHFGTNVTTVAKLIKKLGGPGYSFTVHGPDEFDAPTGFNLGSKIEDASFVVAITNFCSAQLKRWCEPEFWDKIKIVHCTVGDDFFDAAVPLNPESRSFVNVGRLASQKGQIVLIDAFAELLSRGHQANLTLVGDGEYRDAIERRIREKRLADHVTITGYVSEAEVRKHIAESRAMVLPSFAEGLPMVIMEAFAVGRVVISTYIAGIPELVHESESGWLVPADNVEKLVDAMEKALLSSEDRLSEMAVTGRSLTRRYHRTETEGAVLESLFLSCVEGK